MPPTPCHPALDAEACYAALSARDPRFDGRFFVGVSSTGIYCRPVCRVQLPKKENCNFYRSAALAEKSGYRPCLKCRPELTPGLAQVDATTRLAGKAAALIDNGELADQRLSDLAASLGISERHLRRVFLAEYGVSPVQYLQTRKLLLAKNLLTDTRLPVIDVAMLAGFGSLRRFNDLFKKQYRMTPGQLRQAAAKSARLAQSGLPKAKTLSGWPATGIVSGQANSEQTAITVLLGYRPPYDWDGLLGFLAARAVPGLEETASGVYRRTLSLTSNGESCQGWISALNLPQKNALSVTISSGLLKALTQVLARVRSLFDLNCSPDKIAQKLAAPLKLPGQEQSFALALRPGLRLPGCLDAFELAVRAVLGQQITVKAARTLAGRLAAGLGKKLDTPFTGLYLTFPAPADFCLLHGSIEERLAPLGITGSRARALLALAQALHEGKLSFSQRADPEEEMAKLLRLPGFGPWTAQYIAMRALAWPDAFLATDYGVKKALPGLSPIELTRLAQAWRPWRSYATLALWAALAEARPLSPIPN